jgi:hypothetical protein
MKYLMLLIIVILMIGCATGEKIRMSVKPGMSKAELIKTLGNPDGFKNVDGREILLYPNRVISGWGMDRTDYFFVFQNDKLVEAGNGEVRQHKNNVHTIFLF